jgi:hypothetical protein
MVKLVLEYLFYLLNYLLLILFKCIVRSNEILGCVGVRKIKPFRTV